MNLPDFIGEAEEFESDKWNAEKNIDRHRVFPEECEEAFFNSPLVGEIPQRNGLAEKRWYLLGVTEKGRRLTIVFTIRKNSIRVISARDMSRKERKAYERKNKSRSKVQESGRGI